MCVIVFFARRFQARCRRGAVSGNQTTEPIRLPAVFRPAISSRSARFRRRQVQLSFTRGLRLVSSRATTRLPVSFALPFACSLARGRVGIGWAFKCIKLARLRNPRWCRAMRPRSPEPQYGPPAGCLVICCDSHETRRLGVGVRAPGCEERCPWARLMTGHGRHMPRLSLGPRLRGSRDRKIIWPHWRFLSGNLEKHRDNMRLAPETRCGTCYGAYSDRPCLIEVSIVAYLSPCLPSRSLLSIDSGFLFLYICVRFSERG